MAEVSRVATLINDCLEGQEERQQISALQSRLGNQVQLVGPSAKLLKHGSMSNLGSARSGDGKPVELILMSSQLVVATPQGSGSRESWQLRLLRAIPLVSMRVE